MPVTGNPASQGCLATRFCQVYGLDWWDRDVVPGGPCLRPCPGGPVPQHFLNATTRLQMGRCSLLAFVGGVISGIRTRKRMSRRGTLMKRRYVPRGPLHLCRLLCAKLSFSRGQRASQDLRRPLFRFPLLSHCGFSWGAK